MKATHSSTQSALNKANVIHRVPEHSDREDGIHLCGPKRDEHHPVFSGKHAQSDLLVLVHRGIGKLSLGTFSAKQSWLRWRL